MPGEQETLSSDLAILPQCSVPVGLCIGKTRSGPREQGSLLVWCRPPWPAAKTRGRVKKGVGPIWRAN